MQRRMPRDGVRRANPAPNEPVVARVGKRSSSAISFAWAIRRPRRRKLLLISRHRSRYCSLLEVCTRHRLFARNPRLWQSRNQETRAWRARPQSRTVPPGVVRHARPSAPRSPVARTRGTGRGLWSEISCSKASREPRRGNSSRYRRNRRCCDFWTSANRSKPGSTT